MSELWVAIVLLGVGCYLLKLLGVSIPERVLDHPLIQRAAGLMPVALLTALVAVSALTDGASLKVNVPVLAGLGAAVVALLLRAPFLIVLAVAAAAAAGIRLLSG